MKRDEPFNPFIKSIAAPAALKFRLATRNDCEYITNLLAERNPNIEVSKLQSNTKRELERLDTDLNYKLCVAELKSVVVGFCRFYHSSGMPEPKKVYPSPVGWYAMGIMVDSRFRRKNIARFLSINRIEFLKKNGVKELYSIVDSNNLTSMRMHQDFRFEEILRADGFLHLKFDKGKGVLFKLTL